MKKQMRSNTVPYLAKIVDIDTRPSIAERSLTKLVCYPVAVYFDGEREITARHYTSVSLKKLKRDVGDELTVFVNRNMKEGFYLPEEISRHGDEARVYFVIAAVLIIAGIAMQLM